MGGPDVLVGWTGIGVLITACAVDVGMKGDTGLKLGALVRGANVSIKSRIAVGVRVVVGVSVTVGVAVGVFEAVGVGRVPVGNGPSKNCWVSAIAVLVPGTPLCALTPVDGRNVIHMSKLINKIQTPNACK